MTLTRLKRRLLLSRTSRTSRSIGVLFAVLVVLGSAMALLPTQQSHAATSSYINFQARLQTASGAIVPDGNYNIEFKLYNSSSSTGSSQGSCSGDTNCLWTETRTGANVVTVRNGYLTVNLGSVTALPSIDWSQQLWLTMRVGGTGAPSWDSEMNPKLQLTATPYAFAAGKLQTTSGANTSTLSITAPTGGSQNFVIPDQGAAGTYTLLTTTSAAGSYIQNTTSPQTANFNITGNGTIGGTLTNTGTALFKNSSNSATAFQVQASGGANMLTVDTSHNAVIIGSTGSGSAASAALFFGDNCSNFTQTCLKIGEYNGTDSDNLQLHGAAGLTFTTGYASQTVTGVLTSTGRLGIGLGNNAPSAALDITGVTNGVDLLRVTDSTPTAQLVMQITDEGATLFKNRTNSTSAFQVQPSGSTTPILNVDSTNSRVGVGLGTPGYKLDVAGDLNVSTGSVYRVAGAAGTALTCTGGMMIQNATVTGGIITAGSCASASGFGVTSIGTIDSQTKSANGAVISVNSLVLQSADASNPGLVTASGSQTFAGTKTFSGAVTATNASNALGGNGSGLTSLNATNLSSGTVATGRISGSYTGITGTGALAAGSIASGFGTISTGNTISTTSTITGATINATTTFQVAGNAGAGMTCTGGQFIQNATVQGGIITAGACAAATSGVTTVGTLDSQTKNANGAVISGSAIYMQSADASNAGLVTASGTQTFAGNKVFTGDTTAKTTSATAFQVQNAGGTPVVTVDTTLSKLTVRSANESATLGAEMMTASNSFAAATGWTAISGTAQAATATHTNGGGTTAISPTPALSITAGTTYQLIYTVSGMNNGSVDVSLGGANNAGVTATNGTFTETYLAASTANLQFIPNNIFDGTISGVSVKVLTKATNVALALANSTGTASLEMRVGANGSNNAAVGLNALSSNTTGTGNTAFGTGSLGSNLSGNNNTAVGFNSLANNTTGTYNTAFGYQTLQANTIGGNNVAMGFQSLYSNTSGGFNTAIGHQSLSNNISGNYNSALGLNTLFNNTNGQYNVALGYNTGYQNINGNYNTFVGSYAGATDGNMTTGASVTNATALGFGAVVQQSNSLILGASSAANWVKVGIGTTQPDNLFTVSPYWYDSGTSVTATQSGNTLTASGSAFSSAMVGMEVIFNGGFTKEYITGYTSATVVTVSVSQTIGTGQYFRVQQQGFNVTDYGRVGIGVTAPVTALQVAASAVTPTSFKLQDSNGNDQLTYDSANSRLLTNTIDSYANSSTISGPGISYVNRVHAFTPGNNTFGTGAFSVRETFTPKPNTVLVAYISAQENCSGNQFNTDGSPLTVSGGGLTWVAIGGARSPNSTNCDTAMRAFYAVVSSSPPSNVQIVADAGAYSIYNYTVTVNEYSNVNTTTPVTGAVGGGRLGNPNDTWTATLGTSPSGGDWKIAYLADQNSPSGNSVAINTPSGWTAEDHVFQAIYGNESQVQHQNIPSGTTLNYALNSTNATNTETAYGGFILKQAGTTGSVLNLGTTNATQVNIGGQVLLRSSTASGNAFQVQDPSGASVFTVDTATSMVRLGGGFQGGSYNFTPYVTGSTTLSVNQAAYVYYLAPNSGDTTSNVTTTLNLTGLANADGTTAFVGLRALKDYTPGFTPTHTVNFNVNGTFITSVTTGPMENYDNDGIYFMLIRINNKWQMLLNGTLPDEYTADLAEFIHYTGDKPQPGDLLTAGDDANQASVKKSKANDNNVIGVVTTSPAMTFYNNNDGQSTPMALTGRVPVKVSLENGPIQAGDYLAPSSIPGVAAKAIKPGKMIGTALVGYSGGGDGTVMTQVQPGYAVPVAAAGADANGLQGSNQGTASGSVTGQAGTEATTSSDHEQVLSLQTQVEALQGNVSKLNDLYDGLGTELNTSDVRTRSLTVSDSATISGDLKVDGYTKVRDIELSHIITTGDAPKIELLPAAGSKDATDTTPAAQVTVQGNDTAGTITVVAGSDPGADALAKLIFNKPFANAPQIVITPVGKESAGLNAYIDSPSATDFILGVTAIPQAAHTYRYTYHIMQ